MVCVTSDRSSIDQTMTGRAATDRKLKLTGDNAFLYMGFNPPKSGPFIHPSDPRYKDPGDHYQLSALFVAPTQRQPESSAAISLSRLACAHERVCVCVRARMCGPAFALVELTPGELLSFPRSHLSCVHLRFVCALSQ